MATSQADSTPTQTEIDHLSSLPDALLITILSLLPTAIAARTSVLCRRFRHLWKASPAVDLSFTFKKKSTTSYVAMANSAILSRQPSNTLLRLRLQNYLTSLPSDVTPSFITSLFAHAHSLGPRHLTLDGYWKFDILLHSVFSISTLESLSIRIDSQMPFPSATTLTRLKSLSINLHRHTSAQLQRLLLELCCLEHLQLFLSDVHTGGVSLSSLTTKTLVLDICTTFPETDSLGLSMPSLEFLYLKNPSCFGYLPHIHGDFPLLKKSVITLGSFYPKDVTVVAQFLNCISHVEELSLDLAEAQYIYSPFGILLEPGKEAPAFPNLKHLDAHMCFHEHNFEAIVSFLCQSPALQSLKLIHKAPDSYTFGRQRRKRKDWRSKLPRNTDGNYQHAYFSNLHSRENNKRFMKLLNKKSTPKKLQAHN